MSESIEVNKFSVYIPVNETALADSLTAGEFGEGMRRAAERWRAMTPEEQRAETERLRAEYEALRCPTCGRHPDD